MKGKAYYFDFDATIWLSSMSKIQLCTHQEKGVFIDLCALCLLQNGFFEDDEFLAKRLRVDNPTLRVALASLLKLNLLVKDGSKLGVKFILEKLGRMEEYRKKQIINGKKGGRPKPKITLPKAPSQEQEQEQERKKKETAAAVSKEASSGGLKGSNLNHPGSIAEIIAEAVKIGYAMPQEDAEKFLNSYGATAEPVSGLWKHKGALVSDWRRLLPAWKVNAASRPLNRPNSINSGRLKRPDEFLHGKDDSDEI